MVDVEAILTTNKDVRNRKKHLSVVISGEIFRLGLTMGILTGTAMAGTAAISTAAIVQSYGAELDNHRFGIETGKKIKGAELKQLAALRIEDLSEQTAMGYPLENKLGQVYLEINRLTEKTTNMLLDRTVPKSELRNKPDRIDFWEDYKQVGIVPVNVNTYSTTSGSIEGLVIQTSFSFIRTNKGRIISSAHTQAFLPTSNNPNYSDLFNKIRKSGNIEGDPVKEKARFEELKVMIKQLGGDSKTGWEWETGYIGRPKVNYLTLGVIGKYTEGGIDYRFSLNSLGDLEIHKELRLDPVTRATRDVSNAIQTPMAIAFRRI